MIPFEALRCRRRHHPPLPRLIAALTVFLAAGALPLGAARCRTGATAPVSGSSASLTATPAPAPPPPRVVVAVDRSESTAPHRARQLDILDGVAVDAGIAGSEVDVWAFDRTAARVWGPNVPASAREMTEVKGKEFRPNAAAPRRVTRPALLLRALADDPDTAALAGRGVPLRLVLLTDGDSEQAGDEAAMKQAAAALARTHPDLEVLVVGVNSASRSLWDRTVVPALAGGGGEGRFKAVTHAEADGELRRLLSPAR